MQIGEEARGESMGSRLLRTMLCVLTTRPTLLPIFFITAAEQDRGELGRLVMFVSVGMATQRS